MYFSVSKTCWCSEKIELVGAMSFKKNPFEIRQVENFNEIKKVLGLGIEPNIIVGILENLDNRRQSSQPLDHLNSWKDATSFQFQYFLRLFQRKENRGNREHFSLF